MVSADMDTNTMNYAFTVEDDCGEIIFKADEPTLEMLEEQIGVYERHIKPESEDSESEITIS